MGDYVRKEREIWEELEGQTVEVRIGTDWGSDEGFAVVTLHDLETGMFYVIDHYTVPRATEQEDSMSEVFKSKHGEVVSVKMNNQEDSMSEVTFTEEEAEKQKEFIEYMWHELGWTGGIYTITSEKALERMRNFIDDHTKESLTFPCPGCGEEMECQEGWHFSCWNHSCPVDSIKRDTTLSLTDFSEALNS